MKKIYCTNWIILLILLFNAENVIADSKISLNGVWKLSLWPQQESIVYSPSDMSKVNVQTIDAIVPGNVEIDMLKAGLIKDPMIGGNINDLRKYEAYQWCYSKRFESPSIRNGERCEISFGGIDCFAEIWLNDKKVGSSHNMLIEQIFDVTDLLAANGENELSVIIRSSVIEAQKYILGTFSMGNFATEESVYVRKAPHCYGWDIMPRLVSAGLWRDVSLYVRSEVYFKDVNWITSNIDTLNKTAYIYCDFQMKMPFDKLDNARAVIALKRNGHVCLADTSILATYSVRRRLFINNVDLWWPRGMGEAALYGASVTVIDKNGSVLAKDERRIGIRTIKLDRSEINGDDKNPGRFRFYVNGEPIFIKGTNWVPLDALHSRDKDLLSETMDMVVDLNCNMIRCWGGNVYEDNAFFDRCDEEGIMVWQDFVMGCAFYSQREDFAKIIEDEAVSVVCKLRNHPSLALWSGNNEDDATLRSSMSDFNINPNKDNISRVVLPRVIYEFDPTRPYLPSSPYYSQAVYEAGGGDEFLPENHLWGPRGYYKDDFYRTPTCKFVSEIGYHGCPNLSSLKRMMSPNNVYPWISLSDHKWNDEWITKSTRRFEVWGYTSGRNNLMLNQINILFGSVPDSLDEFIRASQFVQAEAMKFFVEKWRGAKFDDKSGIIWWNVRDGWPIISDAVADYYNSKKLAYYFIKNVQRDVCIMILDKENNAGNPLVAVNDTRGDVSGKVAVTDVAKGTKIYSGDFKIKANGKTVIADLSINNLKQGLLLIEYEINGKSLKNHYLYGNPPYKLEEVRQWLKAVKIYNSECL